MKGLITRQQIHKLHSIDGKEVYLWDSRIAGFCVKVTAKDTKGYYFQYRMGGRGTPTRRLYLGRCDWMTPEQAREEASKAKRAVFAGLDPFEEKRRELGKLFDDQAREWLEQYSKIKKKPKTHLEDQRLLHRIILPALAGRYLSKITTEDIERLHNSLNKTKAQANRVLAVIGTIFKYAIRHKHLPPHANPCIGIKRFPEQSRTRFLRADELSSFIATIDRCEKKKTLNPAFLNLIKLLLFTGCRKDEIRQLRWEQVSLTHHTITLTQSKTGPRTVHVNELAMQVFRKIKRKAGNPWVIPSPTKKKFLGDTAHPWKALCTEAGLTNFRIHDLRHCFASLGVALGIPLFNVGKLLGHVRSETTARYSHLDESALKAATSSISDALKLLMSNPPPQAQVVPFSTTTKGA